MNFGFVSTLPPFLVESFRRRLAIVADSDSPHVQEKQATKTMGTSLTQEGLAIFIGYASVGTI